MSILFKRSLVGLEVENCKQRPRKGQNKQTIIHPFSMTAAVWTRAATSQGSQQAISTTRPEVSHNFWATVRFTKNTTFKSSLLTGTEERKDTLQLRPVQQVRTSLWWEAYQVWSLTLLTALECPEYTIWWLVGSGYLHPECFRCSGKQLKKHSGFLRKWQICLILI